MANGQRGGWPWILLERKRLLQNVPLRELRLVRVALDAALGDEVLDDRTDAKDLAAHRVPAELLDSRGSLVQTHCSANLHAVSNHGGNHLVRPALFAGIELADLLDDDVLAH